MTFIYSVTLEGYLVIGLMYYKRKIAVPDFFMFYISLPPHQDVITGNSGDKYRLNCIHNVRQSFHFYVKVVL